MRILVIERSTPEMDAGEWHPWGLWHTSSVDARLERDAHRLEHPEWRFRVRPYQRQAEK